jgi:hypothetical protein
MFELAALMGQKIPLWALFVIFIIAIWSAIWKILALWKAAKKDSWPWFIILFLFNTLGILEILYIYAFSGKNKARHPAKPMIQKIVAQKVPEARAKPKAKSSSRKKRK